MDCPYGEDEAECDGCGPDSYSCRSHIANECYLKSDKCDGIMECSNGYDEDDCLLLAPSFDEITLNPFVRSSEGVLLGNIENKLYPLCVKNSLAKDYARDVCQREG
jgi:hypothetical protein